MQRTPPKLRHGLTPFVIAALFAGSGLAQELQHAAPPPYSDAKTPAEPSLPVAHAPQERVIGAPRALPEKPADETAARAPRRIDHSHMYYDEPGDGRVWVRGADYKASFGSDGATYYPRFGSRAPANVPHALSPESVTFGGEPIEFARTASAVRTGDRVELDRGAFVEAYDFTPASVEQTFVFATLPRAGDLVVRIPVASTLEGRADDAGLEFRGELGRVTYSRAVAVDAAGHRIATRTEFVDGAITIRVDAAVLASAALPLVIDPVIATFPIDGTTADCFSSDVACDTTLDRWLVVYEEAYSATDHDVYSVLLNHDGSFVDGRYLDITTANWVGPICAGLKANAQCLMVASNTTAGSVMGRIVGTWIMGAYDQLTISNPGDGVALRPVVGGDPYSGLSRAPYYCVAYERIYAADDIDILVRLVAADNTLVGPNPTYFSNSANTYDVRAAISKSNGENEWMIVWERQLGANCDLWGGRVRWDGTVTATPFGITGGVGYEWKASVSSPLTGTTRYLLAYQWSVSSQNDIALELFDGSTVVSSMNLSVEEGFDFTRDQIDPDVDTDGNHFVVAYSEQYFGSDYDIYAAEIGVSAGQLTLVQGHQNLAFSTTQERRPRIAGVKPAGETRADLLRDYGLTWDDNAQNGFGNIEGGLWRGVAGGPKTPFCFGDGSGAACPCGNASASGSQSGCLNSFGMAGRLVATGDASTTADTVVLTATGLPAGSTPPTFIQGTAQSNGGLGIVFGDGLRCAVGTVIRLGTPPSSGGAASFGYGVPGTPLVSVRGAVPPAGGTRYYQVTYRNSAAFCTSDTFNTTNGVRIAWTP